MQNKGPNDPVITAHIWMLAFCAAVINLHVFDRLKRCSPGNQYTIIQGSGTKVAFCAHRKVKKGEANSWSAQLSCYLNAFLFSPLVSTIEVQDLGGSLCRCTNSFSPLSHLTHPLHLQQWHPNVWRGKRELREQSHCEGKVAASGANQSRFLQPNLCVFCVQKNIMWFHQLQVTTGQPVVTRTLFNTAAACWPNNAEEEVQINPRAGKGHVYLTCWPDTQSAVRFLLKPDPAVICRVTQASVWRAAEADTTGALSESPPIAVKRRLFGFIQTNGKKRFVCLIPSHWNGRQAVKTSDSPVYELKTTKKENL